MAELKKVRTEMAEVYVEGGIFHIFMLKAKPTVADFQAHLAAATIEFGDIFPLPFLVRPLKNAPPPSRELLAFIGGEEMAAIIAGVAIINDSMLVRSAANLFFKVSASRYPMQMFGSEKAARQWLLSLVK